MSQNESFNNKGLLVLNIKCFQSKEQYHLDEVHGTVLLTVWILALLLILPITLTNMFAIHVFMKKEQMMTSSNILLLHTALCDAMFGCVAMPIWCIHMGDIIFDKSYSCISCGLSHFFALTLPWMSFLTTFLIALDKHLAIFHPYWYKARVQGRRHMFIVPILVFWLLMVGLQSTWFFTKVPLSEWAAFIIPLLCAYSIYVHIHIYILVKRTRITIRSHEVAQKRVSSNSKGKNIDDLKDVKTVRLTSLMLASLCICYLPYFALQICKIAYGNKANATIHTAVPVVLLIGATKCLINPLLYYYQKQAIKDSVSRVIVRFTTT